VRLCRKAILITLCVAAFTGCESGKDSVSTATATGETVAAPSVKSSLQGLTVLPPSIRWAATTSLPPKRVRAVRFYVAGDRWWIDHVPPYTYGPDGAVLPTHFISSLGEPGEFVRFGVRVLTTDGGRSGTLSQARAPEPSLARHSPGNFGRDGYSYLGFYGFGRLSAADLANPPHEDFLSSYTGTLAFVRASVFTEGDRGSFAWEMASDRKYIYLGMPIYFYGRAGPARFLGYTKLRESLCPVDGPPATYAWSVGKGRLLPGKYHARYLHLRAVKESCDERRQMLEGVWDEFRD
jgi:hypothetical protein